MSTFVSVGNATQPFMRLLNAVCAIADQLPQPVFVQYGAASDFFCGVCQSAAFLEMGEFASRVSEAELLIMHAGAGSAIHAIQAGKMPVLVPRLAALGEHVDDHQVEFSSELEKIGKAFVARDVTRLDKIAKLALSLQCQQSLALQEPKVVGLIKTLIESSGK